jgi:mono/diheme cytochrome c family protein
MKRAIGILILILAAVFALIQLVPYGRAHDNPAVQSTPNWDSPQTEALARRSCFDCHSNETIWPWYSNIAPASWLIQRDVDEGRLYLNFSVWDGYRNQAGEIVEIVQEGEMPPFQYFILHPNARFTDAERQQFIQGIQTTATR